MGYSRKEFYTICGISKGNLNVNIGRGKVVVNTDGEIDTDPKAYPMNLVFMEKRTGKDKPAPKQEAAGPPNNSKLPITVDSDESEEDRQIRIKKKYDIDELVKQADLDKKKIDIQLKEAELAKKTGELIPTELVREIITQQSKSMTTSFHQGADNLLDEIAKLADLDSDMTAKLRGQLVDIINDGIKSAQKETKRELKIIVDDYSEQRGVGEKK